MTRMRLLLLGGVLLVGGAYMAGFWPERQRLTAARSEMQALEQRASASEARVRLGEVLGQLLSLVDAVDQQNYGDAAKRASLYFDRVQAEASKATSPAVRAVLEGVEDTRDTVITGLAKAEPTVRDILRKQQLAIRRALDYDVGE